LRRFEPTGNTLQVSQLKCALCETQFLILRESPLLYLLDLCSQALEPFRHLRRADHYLVGNIAPVAHTLRRKGTPRNDQTVRANDAKDSDTELIGARAVVAIQKEDLQHGIIELHGLERSTLEFGQNGVFAKICQEWQSNVEMRARPLSCQSEIRGLSGCFHEPMVGEFGVG
jgi:hypothetical protein